MAYISGSLSDVAPESASLEKATLAEIKTLEERAYKLKNEMANLSRFGPPSSEYLAKKAEYDAVSGRILELERSLPMPPVDWVGEARDVAVFTAIVGAVASIGAIPGYIGSSKRKKTAAAVGGVVALATGVPTAAILIMGDPLGTGSASSKLALLGTSVAITVGVSYVAGRLIG
jgi:hypothetical protein